MSVNFHTPGLTKKIVLGFTLILFCLGLGFFLNNDFWQDEIFANSEFSAETFKKSKIEN